MDRMAHDDLAVVGGGIAGLYCCLHAPAGMSFALFEATERAGGKIETVSLKGFQAEYGALRFDPDRQPRVGRLRVGALYAGDRASAGESARFSLKSHRQCGTSKSSGASCFALTSGVRPFFTKDLGSDTWSSRAGAPFNARLGKEEEYV
jgi:hypothetical protein